MLDKVTPASADMGQPQVSSQHQNTNRTPRRRSKPRLSVSPRVSNEMTVLWGFDQDNVLKGWIPTHCRASQMCLKYSQDISPLCRQGNLLSKQDLCGNLHLEGELTMSAVKPQRGGGSGSSCVGPGGEGLCSNSCRGGDRVFILTLPAYHCPL